MKSHLRLGLFLASCLGLQASGLAARELLLAGPCEIEGTLTSDLTDIAVDRTVPHLLIYTVDRGNDRVIVYDHSDSCIFTTGSTGNGNGELDQPNGIAVDSDGYLYVADSGNDRIQKFDTAFGKNPGDLLPFVEVFDTPPGGLSDPRGLGLDSEDRIYVADTGNDRIVIFDREGNFLKTLGTPDDGDGELQKGEFLEPVDVAVCPDSGPVPGRIYVLDRGRDDLQIFDPLDDGAAYRLASGREGSDPGELQNPGGISLDSQCNVYVADTGNDRVQMLDRDGGVLEIIAANHDAPAGVGAETISSPQTAGLYISLGGVMQKWEDIDYDTTGDGDPDSDGDRYPDLWESDGIDFDGDGEADLLLPGANPSYKDIYVEVDYMPSHQPRTDGLADVVAAFAAAPVANPNGQDGIALHVEVDEQIPHQDDLELWDDFDTLKAASFGTPAQRANAAVLGAKKLVYRYALFIHQYDGNSSSGRAKSGGNFAVSLGASIWDQDLMGHSVGSRKEQAGTFMHELGHTLGLGHGGATPGNYKPNHLSVMSYNFQTSWVQNSALPDGRLDYSRQKLPTLDEQSLDESQGIGLATVGNPQDLTRWLTANGVNWLAGAANLAMDFDGDGVAGENGVANDVNGDRACIEPGVDKTLDSTPAGNDVVAGNEIHDGADLTCGSPVMGDDELLRKAGNVEGDLEGSDDWASIDYNFRNDPGFAGIAPPFPAEEEEEELTAEEAKEIAAFWENTRRPKAFTVAAKFVCAPEVGPTGAALRPGEYRTVINVRNPSAQGVDVTKHAVAARSEDEERGAVSAAVVDRLEPGQAFSVDCRDVHGLFGGAQPIGDGFVVLDSDLPLELAAVYTTDAAVDVEYLSSRPQGGARSFEYSAKFICVPEVGPAGAALRPGDYRTVVNVRNPGPEDVTLTKTAVIARSEDEERGPISAPVQDALAAGQALSVDCRDIAGLFGNGQELGDGFLVLRAPQELEVTAVYSAAADGKRQPEIDVEPVPMRQVAAATASRQPRPGRPTPTPQARPGRPAAKGSY